MVSILLLVVRDVDDLLHVPLLAASVGLGNDLGVDRLPDDADDGGAVRGDEGDLLARVHPGVGPVGVLAVVGGVGLLVLDQVRVVREGLPADVAFVGLFA